MSDLRRAIRAFCCTHLGGPAEVRARPLLGGLEARQVLRVQARPRGRAGEGIEFVVKQLEGCLRREAELYALLPVLGVEAMAPRLLARQVLPDGAVLLFLEYLPPAAGWPWGTLDQSVAVMRALARLHHRSAGVVLPGRAAWDYDGLLAEGAARALAFLEEAPRRHLPASILRTRPCLRRLVGALPRLRLELSAAGGPPAGLLHGDVHTGNVTLRSGSGNDARVVLIDWARARVGTPFEDVASWLHSLGMWEPEAGRRHDTLLRHYLRARHESDRLSPELRARFWLASACNALAGAFLHHLAGGLQAARRGRPPSELGLAWWPAQGWARVLRRAAACWG